MSVGESGVSITSDEQSKIAEAAQRRMLSSVDSSEEAQQEQERDLRQSFRRLLDPGIIRPNSKEATRTSLKTLSTLADNLLADPTNDKFRRFKPTNSIIKRDLVDVQGALEFAIAMGFRPEVDNFQPYYVHSSARIKELRIGASILREAVQREEERERKLREGRVNNKAVAKSISEQVKKNYLDDRKEKQLRDEMERQRQLAAANAPPPSPATDEQEPPQAVGPLAVPSSPSDLPGDEQENTEDQSTPL